MQGWTVQLRATVCVRARGVRVLKITEQAVTQCVPEVLASYLGRDFASFLSPFRQMAVQCPQLFMTLAIHSLHHRWWLRCLIFPQKCGRWYSACYWHAGADHEGFVVKRVVGSWSIRNGRQCDSVVVTSTNRINTLSGSVCLECWHLIGWGEGNLLHFGL